MDLLPRIEIDGASKTIGNSVVLDQIQLTVKPGEMIGLQGVNGSGKTMLLRLISGLIYPTKGHVLIDGKMLGSDLEFPPSIGFLIENPTFLPQYTGAENLQMLSSLHQMMPTAQIESVLQRVGLHDTKYKKYSLGMKQRLGIAAAVFEQPDIILLDEPTNALDESGITMLENVIQDETSRGATIVMASHDMNFLHHCCSKIYTMRAGTLSLCCQFLRVSSVWPPGCRLFTIPIIFRIKSLTKFIRRVILFQLATTILFLRMRTLTVIVCKSMMQNC